MCVDEGVARDGLGDGKAVGGFTLGALLGLTVERTVIDRQRTFCQNTVGQNLIARLEQDDVADNDFVCRNDLDDALAACLDRVLFLGRLEVTVRAVIGNTGTCRDKVYQQDGDDGTDRLIPVALAHEEHTKHDGRDDAQNADHRVLESLEEHLPEGFRLCLRDTVRAVFFPAFLDLSRGQAV